MSTISEGKYLLDSNILVYSTNQYAPLYRQARSLIEEGVEKEGVVFVVAHQNLLEFIAVMTRAYKAKREHVLKDAEVFEGRFEIIHPQPTTFQLYLKLAKKAKQTSYPHHLYLAASMIDNNVERIITANPKDFEGTGLKEVIVP